jgi:hypothetical protein
MANASERGFQRIEPRHVTFSDTKTRRRMEIRQQVQHLAATLPPLPIPEEGYDLTPISFGDGLRDDGNTALLCIGDYVERETHGAGENKFEVTFVQPRTLQILDALSLPYINHAAIEPVQE